MLIKFKAKVSLQLIVIFVCFSLFGFAQIKPTKDSLVIQGSIGFNLFTGLFNGEVAPYLEYNFSNKWVTEISAGKIYYGVNIISNGGSGNDYKNIITDGYIVRSGIKHYAKGLNVGKKNLFYGFKYSFKELDTPVYCTGDGSNGQNMIHRETFKKHKKINKLVVTIGKTKVFPSGIYTEVYIGGGLGFRKIDRVFYGSGGMGNCMDTPYKDPIKDSYSFPYPTFEMGFKVGIMKIKKLKRAS